MFAHRLLILTARDNGCSHLPCNQLVDALSESFRGVAIELHDLASDRKLEPVPHPSLVLVRSGNAVEMDFRVKTLRKDFPQTPFLGILCRISEDRDVPHSLIEELDDHLCCPFRPVDLSLRMRRFLGEVKAIPPKPEWDDFRKGPRFSGFLGESFLFRQALEKVPSIATSDCTCLIEGPTGTGKELFARAIHYLSPRRSKPFVPVNCGSLPENLIENELFGHVKGAYTDAAASGVGLLPYAEDGTLFLDEIDALSLSAQVKLLRVLQEHEYRPVGSPRMHTSKARILAATNANLRARIESKQFREDLYHRLNILRLTIPQLSERADDIPLLARYFLHLYGERHGKKVREISPKAMHKLSSYSWPGNVRELESVIHRSTLLCSSNRLEADDIDIQKPTLELAERESTNLRAAKALAVERFERNYLAQLMSTHQGNVSQAARAAGKERRSFQRLLQKYQIASNQYRPEESS